MPRTEFGELIENESAVIFFGNADFQPQVVDEKSPRRFLSYSFLQQVHGADILEGPLTQKKEADGQWTSKRDHALCIVTADCQPILISHSEFVLALHGGWRGLAANILGHAASIIEERGRHFSDCHFYVGPHIGPESFEVGPEVPKALGQLGTSEEEMTSGRYLNLGTFTQSQLVKLGARKDQIWMSPTDTFTSSEHHSFRRDAEKAGRQVSLIALK